MCGRYHVDINQLQMTQIFEQLNEAAKGSSAKREQFKKVKQGEIFPTDLAPILLANQNQLEPTIARWGFSGFKSPSHSIINSRAESIEEKRMFTTPFRETRCIIPATGFYEWSGPKGKRVRHLLDDGSAGLIYMAGIWREEPDGMRYSIITTESKGEIGQIHNRMPVLLHADALIPYLEDLSFARMVLKDGYVLPQFVGETPSSNELAESNEPKQESLF